MTKREKIFWGGLGGICPVLLMLVTVDLPSWIEELTAFKIIGFILRTVILFIIGAIVGSVHNETNKYKVFELGIMAPAMITTLINGLSGSPKTIGFLELSNKYVLYAQTNSISPKLLKIEPISPFDQVWQGAIGRTPSIKNTFIVLEKYDSLDNAQSQIKYWSEKYPKDKIEIYSSSDKDGIYYITIGSSLTPAQADILQKNTFKNQSIDIEKIIKLDAISQKDIYLDIVKTQNQ